MNMDWPICEVLRLARWAPSGDNGQPWRFRILGRTQALVHVEDTSARVLYDYKGRASCLAAGALLETASIAANAMGFCLHWERVPHVHGEQGGWCFRCELEPLPHWTCDGLARHIESRSVQRRALSRAPLQAIHRMKLEESVAAVPGMQVLWMDAPGDRLRMAKLMWLNGWIRLSAPEAYAAHCAAIEWRSRYSFERMPDSSIGLDPWSLAAMRWAMRRWERVDALNRYCAGTWLPRLQLDVLPSLRCAAHFLLLCSARPCSDMDYLEAGRAVQRFWLTAERHGLRLQPEVTPLTFHWHHKDGARVSRREPVQQRVGVLSRRMECMWPGETLERCVFMGRVGYGPAATSRSLRKSLHDLQDEARA